MTLRTYGHMMRALRKWGASRRQLREARLRVFSWSAALGLRSVPPLHVWYSGVAGP